MEFEEEETNRPEWYGTQVRVSPVTGKKELHYPDQLRLTKMVTSSVCIMGGILIVLCAMTCAIVYRVYAHNVFGTCSVVPDYITKCVQNGTALQSTTSCYDPCWGLGQTACNATNALTTLDGSTPATCQWVTPAADAGYGPYCAPACPVYTTALICTQSTIIYGGSPLPRDACQFVDVYYGSTVTAALINLFVIQVLGTLFQMLAQMLNDWENHRTDTIYEDNLIIKTFFFNFLNSYTSLFYIAFFKGSLGNALFGRIDLRDECLYGGCLTELMIQLVIIFLGQQIITKVTDVGIPYIKSLFRRRAEAKEKKQLEEQYKLFSEQEKQVSLPDAIDPANEMQKPPQWIKDEKLEEFKSLFSDYNWLAVQFGYITLFVVAFPLAPLAGLLNNFTEIRSDSYRLITRYQRPPAIEAEDIGSWYDVFNILGILAVITNAFLISFSSIWVKETIIQTIVPDYAVGNMVDELEITAFRLVIVLVFEHAVFALKLLIAFLVPDIPGPVQMAIDRERFLARKAIQGVEDHNPFDVPDEEIEGLLSFFKK